jgi:hypothetical protein
MEGVFPQWFPVGGVEAVNLTIPATYENAAVSYCGRRLDRSICYASPQEFG